MLNKSDHYKDYAFLKKLIDEGFETVRIKYKFIDDTPNSCLVEVTNTELNKSFTGRLGLSINDKKVVLANFLLDNGSFFWFNQGDKLSSSLISVPVDEFEDLLTYHIRHIL